MKLKIFLPQIAILIGSMFMILLMREFLFRPASDYPGSHFNQGKNAVWLGVEWVSEPHTEAEIVTLANDLAHRQIQVVYSYVTYLRTDTATFNSKYSYAHTFVINFKKAQPGIRLLAWLGLPMPSLGGVADLADPTIRQKVAIMSAYFVHDMGFDGIQLDPEAVVSGDQNLVVLLDETRQAIGSTAFLSLAAEKIQPIFPDLLLAGRFIGWSGAYYHQIALHVDQMAVMAYDTHLHSGWLYRELLRFEVIGVTQAVRGTRVDLLIGISVSDESTDTHDPITENIGNGVQGVIDGLNDADSVPDVISGIAIYPAWEMTPAKWDTYATDWLG